VIGVNSSDLTIGDDAGTISAQAASTISATATTSGSLTGASSATADARQNSKGLADSAVVIGDNGNLQGLSTLNATAVASNVGDVGNNNAANATLGLSSAGIEQAQDAITISGTGNVIGQSLLNASATAQTTNGNAAARGGAVSSMGIDLNHADSDITIGRAGNISGLGVIGTLGNNNTLSDQLDITATTTIGTANANGTFTVMGIQGLSSGGTTLIAGANDGDITGNAFGGASLVASSVGNSSTGNATATVGTSNIVGIQDVDMVGGQVGTNTISGLGVGDFDVVATSVKGNANGNSDVNVYGIFDTAGNYGTINTSGNVSAIARLTNTVTATSVSGSATAVATSNAVGLSGYDVTIIGSGTLYAGGLAHSTSTASSVAGNASAG
jgi:hypothetical protein